MNLPDEQRVELRELAEKATPGPWMYDGYNYILANETSMVAEIRGWGADLGLDDNGRFIAAASPTTVLSLLDRIDELTKERDVLRDEIPGLLVEVNGAKKSLPVWAGLLNKEIASREAAEAERDRMQLELKIVERSLQNARDALRVSIGEVWYWQGDGEDHLESLACPILIRPEQMQKILSDKGVTAK